MSKRTGRTLAALAGVGALGAMALRKKKPSADPQKSGERYLNDSKTGESVKVSPHFVPVVEDLLAKPMVTRGKTPTEIHKMAAGDSDFSKEALARRGGFTDTELRRLADFDDKMTGRKSVRTGYGASVTTGDGSPLRFASDDPDYDSKQSVNNMKKGGKVKSRSSSGASKRGDGIAQRGKTKGRFI